MAVSLDLFRLYAAVNQLELSFQGTGLLPTEGTCENPASDGTISVTFKPAQTVGAAERLARVVSAIKEVKLCPSLLGCDAKVVSIAAYGR